MAIFDSLGKRSKLFILTIGIILLTAVALIDYYIGRELSLKILYLIPLSLVTWYVGLRSGILYSFFCSAIEVLIGKILGIQHSYASYFLLDGLVKFGIFTAFVILLWKLREAMKEIKISNDALLKSNEIKNEFIELAVHDLKNPLSNIIGLSGIINEEDGLEKHEIRELSKRIYTSSERMIKVVNNLLMNREIELDKLRANLEQFDLIPIIEDIIDQNRSAAEAKEISIKYDFPDKSLIVNADVNLTSQVIDNLISNAIKFSPNNKGVWVEVKKVQEGKILDNEPNVRIAVLDEGPGISDDDKKKLFGRFMKLSAKPTGSEHSTGLGLFLVKKFVDAMGGKIWCESEINKGAKFIVLLHSGKAIS